MNLFNWLNKTKSSVPQETQVVKPPKDFVIACLNGDSSQLIYLYARQHVNFFRELEGLPLINKEDGKNADIYLVSPWMYDMCKKYKHLFEDAIK